MSHVLPEPRVANTILNEDFGKIGSTKYSIPGSSKDRNFCSGKA